MSAPRILWVDGAGNCFALADARRAALAEDAGALARRLCGGGVGAGGQADGLLVLAPPRAGGAARLSILNADGSAALACGNGLRCVAWHLFRELDPARRAEPITIETAAGPRRAWLVQAAGERARVRVEMGRGRPLEIAGPVEHAGRELPARGVSLGNPHCVLRVEDEGRAPVEELGRALQRDPRFPGGVNVGFLARREGAWHLRVFERGVGETAACGSGACAAALAWGEDELAQGSFGVWLPGGPLTVDRAPDGVLQLTGEARVLGCVEHPL